MLEELLQQVADKNKNRYVILVDLDGWIFQSVMVTKTYKKLKENAPIRFDSLPALMEEAIPKIDTILKSMLHKLPHSWDKLFAFVSIKAEYGYHRHKILPSYKSNRKKKSPTNLELIARQAIEALKLYYMEREDLFHTPVKTIGCMGYEADDLISVVAGMFNKVDYKVVLFRVDKDLETIPNTVQYIPQTSKVVSTDADSAEEMIHYQMVVGDNSDGYKGLTGRGASWYNSNMKGLSRSAFKSKYIAKSSLQHYEEQRAMAEMLTVEQAEEHHPEMFTKLTEVTEHGLDC